jgi:cytohesin
MTLGWASEPALGNTISKDSIYDVGVHIRGIDGSPLPVANVQFLYAKGYCGAVYSVLLKNELQLNIAVHFGTLADSDDYVDASAASSSSSSSSSSASSSAAECELLFREIVAPSGWQVGDDDDAAERYLKRPAFGNCAAASIGSDGCAVLLHVGATQAREHCVLRVSHMSFALLSAPFDVVDALLPPLVDERDALAGELMALLCADEEAPRGDARAATFVEAHSAVATLLNERRATNVLHYCAALEWIECARAVLKAVRADSTARLTLVNGQDRNGRTPLHAALLVRCEPCVRLFVQAGADVDDTLAAGELSARSYAQASDKRWRDNGESSAGDGMSMMKLLLCEESSIEAISAWASSAADDNEVDDDGHGNDGADDASGSSGSDASLSSSSSSSSSSIGQMPMPPIEAERAPPPVSRRLGSAPRAPSMAPRSPSSRSATMLRGFRRKGTGASASSAAMPSSGLTPRSSRQAKKEAAETARMLDAAAAGDGAALKAALDGGANASAVDSSGATALHKLALCGQQDADALDAMVAALLDAGAPLERLSMGAPVTPLLVASAAGNAALARALVRRGASVSAADERQRTALHLALENDHGAVVEALLADAAAAAGAPALDALPVNAIDRDGVSPLHLAAMFGNAPLASLLIASGAKVNVKDSTNRTPIGLACRSGSPGAVAAILKAGILGDDSVNAELVQAAFAGRDDIVRQLLDAGFDVNSRDAHDNTPLHKAVLGNRHSVVELLLSNGADVAAANSRGRTALHLAASGGSVQCANKLLEAGGEVDVQDDEERSPLHVACECGTAAVVELLLSCQANFNSCDANGASPLHLAAAAGQRACVDLLVARGASPDGEDDRRKTALHHAVEHADIVELFVEQLSADVDARDSDGCTPLVDALRGSHEQTVRLLVMHGGTLGRFASADEALSPSAIDGGGGAPASSSAADVEHVYIRKVLADARDELRRAKDVKLQKRYAKVVQRFNQKPKDGVKLLLATKALDASTPADVARFLHNARGLNKVKIGEMLGEHDDFNAQVLEAFVVYMDFARMEFDTALRLFLSKFVLPGEAQKIDRIMERLASQYCANNPDTFPHEDVAYMLGFSLIMLNTDLHSPQIKKERKMTRAQFVKNNTGIEGFVDLPAEFLETMYDRIAKNEIKMDQAFAGAIKQGWLVKQKGRRTKATGRRWCVLKDAELFWFKSEQEAYEASDPKSAKKSKRKPPTIELGEASLRVSPSKKHPRSFEIVMSDSADDARADTHLFVAPSADEQQAWMQAIADSVPSMASGTFRALVNVKRRASDAARMQPVRAIHQLKTVSSFSSSTPSLLGDAAASSSSAGSLRAADRSSDAPGSPPSSPSLLRSSFGAAAAAMLALSSSGDTGATSSGSAESLATAASSSLSGSPLTSLGVTSSDVPLAKNMLDVAAVRTCSTLASLASESSSSSTSLLDAEELNSLITMCSIAYKGSSFDIMQLYGQAAVVETPQRGISILIVVMPVQKRQYIVLTGTKWDNAATLKHDMARCAVGQIAQYYELYNTAKSHIDSARKHLRKDLPVHLIGHGIGGAVALMAGPIIAQLKFKLSHITTFGQPAILQPADASRYRKINVTRVVDVEDPVPSLFSECIHVGRMLLLLPDRCFCLAKNSSRIVLPPITGDDLIDSRLAYHHVDYYARGIRALLQSKSISSSQILSIRGR